MLHPVASQITPQDAYFLDSLNQEILSLQAGALTSYHLTSKLQQQISIPLSTQHPQSLPLPSLLSMTGETILNIDRNIAALISEQATLRSIAEVIDGSHWEWHLPLTLEGVELGICTFKDNELLSVQLITFNSSTSRTVTFTLQGLQLTYWVNGTRPAKATHKNIKQDPTLKVYPYATLKGKGSVIVFSPFTTYPHLLGISRFNPFGKLILEQPKHIEPAPHEPGVVNIKQLIQLSTDRFLLVWENNRGRVYFRDPVTNRFYFQRASVAGDVVANLYQQSQYAELKKWRGEAPIFANAKVYNIRQAYEWIAFLVSALDKQPSQRVDLYAILLRKLTFLRPYLHTVSVALPNPILQSLADTSPYSLAFKYFDVPQSHFGTQIAKAFQEFTVEGVVKEVTSNYLVCQKQTTVIVYYIGDTVKEIFRHTIDPNKPISKRVQLQQYQQADLRYLNSEGSFLYKILAGCLNKQRKLEQLHAVNQHDVDELMRDFGIDQPIAIQALERTGSIEEALVWIYTEKDQATSKKTEGLKEKGESIRQTISAIELHNIFARLLLLVDGIVYVLGIKPNQIKNWVHRGENEYVDLALFKHQHQLEDINFQNWYHGQNHPQLVLLDSLQPSRSPIMLFRQKDQLNYLFLLDGVPFKRQINFNFQLLYELQCCLTLSQQQCIIFASQAPENSFNYVRSIKGQLFDPNYAPSEYLAGTVVLVGKTLYTNIPMKSHQALRVLLKIDHHINQSVQTEQLVPLTVQCGPPGINKNYSISNILLPNSSFLANYPHGFRLRHLHNKLIRPTTLTLHRSVNRKNINYITQGTITLLDSWGRASPSFPFSFAENQEEIELRLQTSTYYKEIVVNPQYTAHKKLPFQIGSLTLNGSTLSQYAHQLLYTQIISKVIAPLNLKLQILAFQPVTQALLQIDLKAVDLGLLEQRIKQSQGIKVEEIKKITVGGIKEQCVTAGLQPKEIINAIVPRPEINIDGVLRELSSSYLFTLSAFDQTQVRKFVDLVLYHTGSITEEEYYKQMFDKIWTNPHGQAYLLHLTNFLTEFPLIPFPYLKLLLAQLTGNILQQTLKKTLLIIPTIRSKLYATIKNSKLPYLYFQSQFYSPYYMQLIDPQQFQKQANIYPEPLVPADFAVFKSDYTRRLIIKLPAVHHLTSVTLKVERCQSPAKINYAIFRLTPEGKEAAGSGRIFEHQWTQLTHFPLKAEIQQLYGPNSKLLSVFALDVPAFTAQYLEIQLDFTETGIVCHESEGGKVPQVDILPELYGFEVGRTARLPSVDWIFEVAPEDKFFLSVSALGKHSMEKYSVSKGKNTQFLYYTLQEENLPSIRKTLQQKIGKMDYDSIVGLQRKLIKKGSFSQKVTLDYLYTLFCLTAHHLDRLGLKIEDGFCEQIFTTLVQVAQGPIKLLAFKGISHKIPLLLKSLQFIESELPSLGPVSFSYEQLLDVLDFNNAELCKSLSRLILRGVVYEQKWAQLLIKMSHLTESHSEIIGYFIHKDDWLQNAIILDYLFALPTELFLTVFLDSVSYPQLCRLVLTRSAKPRQELLLQVIVERASESNPVDLDVVSLIFKQEQVRWQQLQRVISCCPQAIDTVIHQFLHNEAPDRLAREHGTLLATAAQPKYAEEFAVFLDNIYRRNKHALAQIFNSLSGKCTSLHYDFLQTIASFTFDLCNIGGVEGARLISEQQLTNLHAAVQMLRVTQKLPEGAELPNQQALIEWYLHNNDYQFTSTNPANKPPAHHLVRTLVELVLALLRASAPAKVLAQYATALHRIKTSRRLSLTQRHLLFNQLHHGATQLLSHTLAPGLLAEVLVGPSSPLLATVINELKTNTLKRTARGSKWAPLREVDLTEKFALLGLPEAKDIQIGKAGSKTIAVKIPLAQKYVKLQAEEVQHPSKFVIAFALNDHTDNKTAILPARVELFSGTAKSLVKVGEMTPIEDQYYLQFGVRLFGLNLNSTFSLGHHALKDLQFRLHQPTLASASDLLQTGQRSKKGATYNLSFLSIYGYDTLPHQEPVYSRLYVTLLGFLGEKKYLQDLRAVIASSQFDQKLELVIQVLNDLLPNQQIEQLLLALNREGESILEHVLRSKGANPRLVNLLMMGKLTKDNINKLILYTLDNLSPQFVNIVTLSLRLASYAHPRTNEPLSNFDNLKLLMQKLESAKGQIQPLYLRLITSIATVPNIYRYEIHKLIQLIWNKTERQRFYPLLAAILPYYPSELDSFGKTYTIELFQEIVALLEKNRESPAVIAEPYNTLALLCTLVLNGAARQILLSQKAPIQLVGLLKSSTSLLVKYENETMRLFINFFQSTCIGTNCQDQFGEILITLMTSLNDFDAIHHQYFIHNFFFPLINAYKGVPAVFVWKYQNNYLKQATDILKQRPIKSSLKVIKYQDDFYHPVEQVQANNFNQNLLFVQKEKNTIAYRLADGILWDISGNKSRKYSVSEGKITVQLPSQSITISNEQFLAYQQSEWQKHLLTNASLTSLENPWILQQSYRTVLSIKYSTPERCYFLPQQMNLTNLLSQFNLGGLCIHPTDLPSVVIKNYHNGLPLTQNTTVKDILAAQEQPYLKIQVQAATLFPNTTIESLAKEEPNSQSFVAQQTIFKAFQEKKGLQKMITVLKGCVKNWSNTEQSNIWGQYLKQLESYSCFPVFSSLYMTKKSNVGLLFDLLLGLPDKQESKKWLQRQKQSVKELYMIIKDVFAVKGQQALVVRQYALKSGFYSTMLQRLHIITKQARRRKVEQAEAQQELLVPTLEVKMSEQEFKVKLEKKKGVGYGTDSSTNQKWDLTGHQQARKQKSQQILGLLKILEQFLDYQDFSYPTELLQQTYQSSLLPIIQSSLRGGSLLEISKFAQLFQGQLSFVQVMARCKNLIPTLMPIPKCYEPKQTESIHSLLKTLNNTSKIFLTCLTGSASEKVSEQIAKNILATFQIVQQAIESYAIAHNDEQQQKKILELPLAKKYPLLMKDLRFDYVDMKDNTSKITKHHYSSSYQAGHKPPVQKTVRLAQELADLSHALPIDHTNAIYVRCDKERVDFMQALIMGSNGTPYGHGAYLFDIHFEDIYPNGPPKVNLTTTGNGQIRFNPNLYACGKVCLSLLGTWRGNATENWDAKVSTLLQVLVSIQSIIMSEDIYFNEPGFEHEQGTAEGEKKNQAYANIVRYGNIKYAMIENIKNPPKGFESIIRRHFYLKKEDIIQECSKWLKLAEKRQASYTGLVSDHNYNWCNTFKKSKTEYKTMLEKAIQQLKAQLHKLPPPTNEDFKKDNAVAKKKKKQLKPVEQAKVDQQIQEIDVSYGGVRQFQELDINDERVKDRWSRYIGAMGVQAVSKQSKASIVLLGLGPVGVQIAKNIVLSGCRELSVWDDKIVGWQDLSGQFFLGESDIGKPRLQSTFFKLQELNHYVKLSKLQYNPSDFSNLAAYQVVIATERVHGELLKLDGFCRSKNIHFLSVDCYGPYGQIFNDFGDSFEIVDKNGEDTIEVLLEQITTAEKGLVRVPKGQRHPYEDGETVRIAGVKGMKLLTNQATSINGTLHKIQVIDQNSFYIGDTRGYSAYEGEGTARNLKMPTMQSFKSLEECSQLQNIDSNLQYYDWAKAGKLRLLHNIFIALSTFRQENSRFPLSWNKQDSQKLVQIVKQKKGQIQVDDIKYIKQFSYSCTGNFGPICAFFGGLASQQAFKAITGKYSPINQYFLAQFSQIIDSPPQDQAAWKQFAEAHSAVTNRTEGLRRVIGSDLLSRLQNCRVFMIGSGAIGCQLLKNFAMLQIGAGQSGSIVVTDPDHIQTSNLNRQFLFRQKHIRKPKSATAAAAAAQMNPRLKGHIKARLDKVCEGTKDIFTNEFFEGQTIIANALDNVEARRYVDSRCVESKVPLLQSGTLSSKGHVQVIIPYKTETYASKQDPNDAQGDIPICTLKMFPEETLHCVEWARDLFSKQFTLGPKALRKLLQQGQKYVPTPSDIQMLKDCVKLIMRRPSSFDDAIEVATNLFYQIFRNDIMQLLYTYPLDAKTKDGKPFWKLPKRPPVPIEQILPADALHATFITSFSVLLARIYNIPFPKDFRDPKRREEITSIASKIKVDGFVPSDKIARQMAEEVNKQNSGAQSGEPAEEKMQQGQQDQISLFHKFSSVLKEVKQNGQIVESKPQQFQKDQDQNGHIDLIYSLANLRARNYKLQQMQWINVKLKAGRIMPALSTTTSCIAALQTIELVKYLRGCPLQAMRNAFINLAVPYMQLGQPGAAQKIKVHQDLQTTLWERWSVGPITKSQTLGQFMKAVQEKYGVIVKGLSFSEGGQIYSDFVMSLDSKKEEKETLLGKQLQAILSEELGQQYGKFADFTLVMGVGQNLIKHAPTLRLLLEP